MLQRAFHYRLDKSLQRTDWTRRPLPPAMVAYAARDAEMNRNLEFDATPLGPGAPVLDIVGEAFLPAVEVDGRHALAGLEQGNRYVQRRR